MGKKFCFLEQKTKRRETLVNFSFERLVKQERRKVIPVLTVVGSHANEVIGVDIVDYGCLVAGSLCIQNLQVREQARCEDAPQGPPTSTNTNLQLHKDRLDYVCVCVCVCIYRPIPSVFLKHNFIQLIIKDFFRYLLDFTQGIK